MAAWISRTEMYVFSEHFSAIQTVTLCPRFIRHSSWPQESSKLEQIKTATESGTTPVEE